MVAQNYKRPAFWPEGCAADPRQLMLDLENSWTSAERIKTQESQSSANLPFNEAFAAVWRARGSTQVNTHAVKQRLSGIATGHNHGSCIEACAQLMCTASDADRKRFGWPSENEEALKLATLVWDTARTNQKRLKDVATAHAAVEDREKQIAEKQAEIEALKRTAETAAEATKSIKHLRREKTDLESKLSEAEIKLAAQRRAQTAMERSLEEAARALTEKNNEWLAERASIDNAHGKCREEVRTLRQDNERLERLQGEAAGLQREKEALDVRHQQSIAELAEASASARKLTVELHVLEGELLRVGVELAHAVTRETDAQKALTEAHDANVLLKAELASAREGARERKRRRRRFKWSTLWERRADVVGAIGGHSAAAAGDSAVVLLAFNWLGGDAHALLGVPSLVLLFGYFVGALSLLQSSIVVALKEPKSGEFKCEFMLARSWLLRITFFVYCFAELLKTRDAGGLTGFFVGCLVILLPMLHLRLSTVDATLGTSKESVTRRKSRRRLSRWSHVVLLLATASILLIVRAETLDWVLFVVASSCYGGGFLLGPLLQKRSELTRHIAL